MNESEEESAYRIVQQLRVARLGLATDEEAKYENTTSADRQISSGD